MNYEFLLQQHIGQPSIPVVFKGDMVKRGQLIAKKEKGKLGANLFASVSGEVVQVDDQRIVIAEANTDFDCYEQLTGTTPLELIEQAGLVGLGGAGFPTCEKLKNAIGTVETLIINAVECEPIISHNISRIETSPKEIAAGIGCVKKTSRCQKGSCRHQDNPP